MGTKISSICKVVVLQLLANAVLIYAANFYVDANIASSGNGSSIGSAFKTIQEAATAMQAGDVCYIRAGIYREVVTPARSGTSGNPIAFQNYNNETVIVNGADPITGWTQHSGSIYKAPMGWTLGAENQVFVNGTMAHQARWPNITNQQDPFFDFAHYASADIPGSGNGHVLDAALPVKPDNFWQNCIIWANFGDKWTGFGTKVTSSTAKDIYYTTPDNINGVGNYDQWFCYPGGQPPWGTNQPKDFEMYYLTGKLELLDAANEWFYDGTSLYLWVNGGGNPGNTVTVKRRGKAFDLSNKSYITVKNISIFSSTINMSNGTYCVLDGINGTYLTHHSHDGYSYNLSGAFASGGNGITMSGSNNQIKNCTIRYTAGSAISISGSNQEVDNNDIQYTNYCTAYSEAITSHGSGTNVRITRNKIWYSGSCLVQGDKNGVGSDDGTFVLYNDAAFGDMLSDDRGAFNGCSWEVAYNWVHDIGRGLKFGYIPGLYTDLAYDNATYHHNVVWKLDGTLSAVQINNTGNQNGNTGIYVYNNTSYSTPGGTTMICGVGPTYTEANDFANPPASNFVNPAAGDFRLASGSAAINSGTVVSTPYNITSGCNGTPDKGAYEYGGTDAVSNWRAGQFVTMYYRGNGVWTTPSTAAAIPVFSPQPGNYSDTLSVTLTSATTGSVIRYTTNGSDPTSASAVYSAPIPVTSAITIRARAFKTGMDSSNIASGYYQPSLDLPIIFPGSGQTITSGTVEISTRASGVQIFYTTNGDDPTQSSTLYTAPFIVTGAVGSTAIIKARAFKNGIPPSSIASVTYTLIAGRNADTVANTTSGLTYKYYEGTWTTIPNFTQLTPVKQGTIDRITSTVATRDNSMGITFSGYIDIPHDGVYKFYTTSDDGSRLFIGNTLVVSNDSVHSTMQERGGTIGLKAGKHAIFVEYFNSVSGLRYLNVWWEGPGIGKTSIPASQFYYATNTSIFNRLFRTKQHTGIRSVRNGFIIAVGEKGNHQVQVLDQQGRIVRKMSGNSACEYMVNSGEIGAGVFSVRIADEKTTRLLKMIAVH